MTAVPPADAEIPERHPQSPAPGSAIGAHNPNCLGCGPRHATGLHLEVVAGEGLSVHARYEVTEHHQGAPGLAHGGVLAVAMDEVLGAANWMLRVPAVTGRLETDFVAPVPVGTVLEITARIVGKSGRKVYTEGEAVVWGTGNVAVRSRGLFIQVPLEHFISHGRAEDVQAAIRERGSVTRPQAGQQSLESGNLEIGP